MEERRLVAPPSFAEAHDQLKQEIMAAAIQQAVAGARSQLTIHRFNLDGSEIEGGPRLSANGSGANR